MQATVLISNDDGILSPNLDALARSIDEQTTARALVVAPERERSAASHAITLHKPLRLKEVVPERRYALSGTPADCVYVGVLKLCPQPPALVMSGINHGFNLGTDVFYSGTVAGAVEGALRGIPAISLSLAPRGDIELACRFAAALAQAALDATVPLPPRTILNVNVPAGASGAYQWTTLGKRHYADDVTERVDPRGRPYYWIGGGATHVEDIPGSDCVAVENGLISVTPLRLDLTASELTATPPWTVRGFEPAGAAS